MRIALIGLGMVADTHLAAIQHSDKGLHLVGVFGRDPGRAQMFSDKASGALGYPVARFTTAREIANSPEIDFVILATPPDARHEIVDMMAAAGKPILMEKPIERTLAAANKIVATCASQQVPLGIVFQHRARAGSQAMKQKVDAGVLGQIATVDIRVPWWREQSYYDAPGRGTYARDGGGVMINQAIHTLDLALWVLGPVLNVQALMRSTPLHHLEAEDWAGALFEMDNGAIGTLMATTAAYPGGAESLSVQGTKASAHLASGVLTVTLMDGRIETIGSQADTGGGADPMAFTHAWHQTIIEDFANCLKSGAPPIADGHSSLAAHRVIDAMERATVSGERTKVSHAT
ncbi:Gfo/Idh/MocA family oxidoreductase [Roseobacter sp. YSTF-M11]|uniref:Gfo/Idh/MocA family oxidoreductase n=1 Tax=Roseobacter insulae TaxID=2859783 RepID=A0A9X1FT91_9RHOB|nr:Gfo/Idh/MocA family oxidoreductase [Roseobacter insulae]MBW4706493.1 Gfo/Idh/MocA family oxidoreductase [Roseobacter insulae]